MDWIQGEKFKALADFTYSPKVKPYPRDDYDNLANTFDPAQLKDCNLIYTHTMCVKMLFDIIRHLSKKFIVITHSCDYSVEECGVARPDGNGKIEIVDRFTLPDNLIKWYSKNVNVINPKIESIPIGLENNAWCKEMYKKEKMIALLKRPKKIKNLVYMNHKIGTNPAERLELYPMFKGKTWVTVGKGANGYKFDEYIDNVYNHKFVICPPGNGMDTHRMWESLYMGTIPIEKWNVNNQFYKDLPICFVDDWNEVTEAFLEGEYTRIKQKTWRTDLLSFEYWKNKIQMHSNFMDSVLVDVDKGSGWGTHQLVLFKILEKINKPVLELGAGKFSTVQIHNILRNRRVKILTIESNQKWLNKYQHLKTDLHDLKYVSEIGKFYNSDNEEWGLVFIDNESPGVDPWEARKAAVLKYSKTADYIILHDCDAFSDLLGESIKPIDPIKHNTGIRDYSKTFKYWIEFFVDGWKQWHPPTLLGSNKICLDDIVGINGMIISNRNAK